MKPVDFVQIFQLQILQEAKERQEDCRGKAEDHNAMMQLIISVVTGIGLSVASFLNNKSLPVTVRTRKRKYGMELDLSSDSESDDESDNAVENENI